MPVMLLLLVSWFQNGLNHLCGIYGSQAMTQNVFWALGKTGGKIQGTKRGKMG